MLIKARRIDCIMSIHVIILRIISRYSDNTCAIDEPAFRKQMVICITSDFKYVVVDYLRIFLAMENIVCSDFWIMYVSRSKSCSACPSTPCTQMIQVIVIILYASANGLIELITLFKIRIAITHFLRAVAPFVIEPIPLFKNSNRVSLNTHHHLIPFSLYI